MSRWQPRVVGAGGKALRLERKAQDCSSHSNDVRHSKSKELSGIWWWILWVEAEFGAIDEEERHVRRRGSE